MAETAEQQERGFIEGRIHTIMQGPMMHPYLRKFTQEALWDRAIFDVPELADPDLINSTVEITCYKHASNKVIVPGSVRDYRVGVVVRGRYPNATYNLGVDLVGSEFESPVGTVRTPLSDEAVQVFSEVTDRIYGATAEAYAPSV